MVLTENFALREDIAILQLFAKEHFVRPEHIRIQQAIQIAQHVLAVNITQEAATPFVIIAVRVLIVWEARIKQHVLPENIAVLIHPVTEFAVKLENTQM